MESTHAPKRRKVAIDSNEAPKSSPLRIDSAKVTSTGPGAQRSQPSPATAATLSAKELWQLAKAQSRSYANRTKASEHENGLSKNATNGEAGKQRSAGGKLSKPVKKQLDPLRNQRESQNVSPKKPVRKDMTGFFKKFHAPKAELEAAAVKQGGDQTKAQNGAYRTEDGRDTHERVVEDEDEGGDITPRSTSRVRRPTEKIIAAGNSSERQPRPQKDTAADRRKKTHEDEMDGIATEAQYAAEDDGSEDELSVPLTSSRRPAPKRGPGRSAVVAGATSNKSSRVQLDRRKADVHRNEEDLMEVDETDAEAQDDSIKVGRSLAANDGNAQIKGIPITQKAICQAPKKSSLTEVVTFDDTQLRCIQCIVLEKATQRRPIPLTNLDEEYTKVSTLVHQTVTAGESNSMLVIGARGSGKSALVNQAIREESAKHSDDFHVVRLNGFLHTDDKIALREIWRQLGREMEIEDDESTSKNYADTLTTLLALLSHASEIDPAKTNQVTKSVIFILDEFDLFAGHPRQTLLYNLFDIAQSRKAPIAVLGLTTRIDVAESLEKRVKSRFSHRYVHLSLAKNFLAFEEVCRVAMSINHGELSEKEKKDLNVSVSDSAELMKNMSSSTSTTRSCIDDWTIVIEQILSRDSVVASLRRLYYTSKAVPDFLTALIMPFATLPIAASTNSVEIVGHLARSLQQHPLQAADSKLDMLSSLSTLQLALLICAARLNAIYNTDIISFALAYEEYKGIASKAKLQATAAGAAAQGAGARVWSKDVARTAWASLIECGLVIEDGRAAGGSGRVDVGLEEIGMCGVDLGAWARWCREI